MLVKTIKSSVVKKNDKVKTLYAADNNTTVRELDFYETELLAADGTRTISVDKAISAVPIINRRPASSYEIVRIGHHNLKTCITVIVGRDLISGTMEGIWAPTINGKVAEGNEVPWKFTGLTKDLPDNYDLLPNSFVPSKRAIPVELYGKVANRKPEPEVEVQPAARPEDQRVFEAALADVAATLKRGGSVAELLDALNESLFAGKLNSFVSDPITPIRTFLMSLPKERRAISIVACQTFFVHPSRFLVMGKSASGTDPKAAVNRALAEVLPKLSEQQINDIPADSRELWDSFKYVNISMARRIGAIAIHFGVGDVKMAHGWIVSNGGGPHTYDTGSKRYLKASDETRRIMEEHANLYWTEVKTWLKLEDVFRDIDVWGQLEPWVYGVGYPQQVEDEDEDDEDSD